MKKQLLFCLLLILQLRLLEAQCIVDPDNTGHWPHWPPILTNQEGELLLPTGTDDNRKLSMAKDEVVLLSCGAGGQFDQDQSWGEGPLYARCQEGQEFSVWKEGEEQDEVSMEFIALGCRSQPRDSNEVVSTCGAQGEGTEVNIGFDIRSEVGGVETVTITVCYDTARSINIWSRHSLWDEIDARDHGNDSPDFKPDHYFDFDVNHFYTMDQQRKTIAEIVRSQDLADQYVQDFDSDIYLARGHMAPNADFIFYSWMDATYHFINVSPQWQAFNGGNWMYFEGDVRDFVVERQMDIVVYTGTHGVCQLMDVDGVMVDIYLYDGDKLPVPRYYWKILHSPSLSAGVAVIGVNNPHLTSLPADYVICPPVENHPILANIHHPEDLFRGYLWACRVEDLAAAVPNVPELPSMDLLM